MDVKPFKVPVKIDKPFFVILVPLLSRPCLEYANWCYKTEYCYVVIFVF